MRFNPKFSSYRFRIAGLALVLIANAFVAVHEHNRLAFGMVILAVATVLAAAIPETVAKVKPERY